MAYIGKTNWQNNEIVEPADMNRIEQGILDVDVELGKVAQDLESHKTESATTSAKGHVQLSDSTSSTSTSLASTANAVRVTYNKAVEALNKANEAFQSASDGKNLIATAITGKGVPARFTF